MTEENASAKSPARQKRVKRLKRIIVGFYLAMVIVPMVIAVFLGVHSIRLRHEINRINEEMNGYLERQSELALEGMGASEIVEPKFPEIQEDSTGEQDFGKPPYSILSDKEIKDLRLGDDELYDGYRKVYLTFDDGPSSNTDDILDILAQYDVKASFFVIKREGKNYEKLYRRIVDEGHTIGMHSCTHEYSVVYADQDSFIQDTENLRKYIYLVTGVESNFYRFPGGSSNQVSRTDMKLLARTLHEMGIEYFDWNASSQDSTGGIHSKEEIISDSIRKIADYDEVIILFHDTNSKVTTVEALPEIIKYIQSLDNTVILPITEGTRPIQHLSAD